MTTMTEQEAVRVLRDAVKKMTNYCADVYANAKLRGAEAAHPIAYVMAKLGKEVIAATATIQQVATPDPVAQGWDEKLFNFIDSVVEVAFEGSDLDGGTIQEWAETAGLLEARTMTEPCSEGQNCRCADGNDFPLTCYQKTYRRAAAPAQAAPDEVRDAGIKFVAAWLDKKRMDYDYEYAQQEHDTGAWTFPSSAHEEYSNTLAELVDEIRTLCTTSTDKGEAA